MNHLSSVLAAGPIGFVWYCKDIICVVDLSRFHSDLATGSQEAGRCPTAIVIIIVDISTQFDDIFRNKHIEVDPISQFSRQPEQG